MTTASKLPVTGGRRLRMSTRDRVTVVMMVLIPTAVVAALVWLPAVATVVMSFFDWDGFGPFTEAKFVGGKWYSDAVTIYPAFWPAIQHNVIWLLVLFCVATPIGMLIAVLLDREVSHTKFYQTALYLPVVLSMALIGFIWQLMFSRDQGLLNALFGTQIDWYGDPKINLWSALIATAWRHVGYVMLLYLAGLKASTPPSRRRRKWTGRPSRRPSSTSCSPSCSRSTLSCSSSRSSTRSARSISCG